MKRARPFLASSAIALVLSLTGCSDDSTDGTSTGGAGGKSATSSTSTSGSTSTAGSTTSTGTTSSTSSAPKPNGQACGGATECSSGFCVDGVCCDTACDGKCDACNATSTAGADGTCAPVESGLDPDDDCGADTCSGMSGICACGDAKKDGEETDIDCGGPGCGKCVEGRDCLVASDCGSGFCPAADKVCCATACDGVCVACAEPKTGFADGQCAAIAFGTDPENECTDPGYCAAANQCTTVLDPSNGAADNVCIHYVIAKGFSDIVTKSDDHMCLAKPLEDIPVSTGFKLYVWSKDAATSNRVRIDLKGLTPPTVETRCSAYSAPPNKAEMDAELIAGGFNPTSWQTDAQVGHILTNAGCPNGAAFRIQF